LSQVFDKSGRGNGAINIVEDIASRARWHSNSLGECDLYGCNERCTCIVPSVRGTEQSTPSAIRAEMEQLGQLG